VNLTVDLVIFVRQAREMGVAYPEAMNLLDLLRELLGKLVRCMGHLDSLCCLG
jgi:hypothetical protein